MLKKLKWKILVISLSLLSFIIINDGCGVKHACADGNGSKADLKQASADKTAADGNDKTGQDATGMSGKDDGDTEAVSDVGMSAKLVIDNKNIYKGMRNSYSKGYVPIVEGKRAVIVLPLLSSMKLMENKLRASLKLGESENLPFVYKNYEKSVKLGRHVTHAKTVKCYLVAFNIELKNKCYNGSYPVTVTVSANDKNGNEIYQDFTVYVTISNGIDMSADGKDDSDDKSVKFAPKVMIRSCRFSKNKVMCGEKFTAEITLYNTSRKNAAKNMMITVQPGENVELLSKTDSRYVRSLGAGKSCKISFVFRVMSEAPHGQYNIDVNLDYADNSGNTYTMQEFVKVSAQQKTRVEIAPVSVPKSIQLGETVQLQAQVMNLGKGKIYHVRAVMEAEGLAASEQAFIGDIDGGTEM